MNDFAIIREDRREGKLFLLVDTSKAVFRGMKWRQLGDWGKHKAENVLFLERMHKAKEVIKIGYEFLPTI